eukprot:EW709227.1.p1 GENE.EW709227.1~~EW709227.1.p1  ORF type:complete len:120 (+),score=33.34 EW709227.1:3-362(+)
MAFLDQDLDNTVPTTKCMTTEEIIKRDKVNKDTAQRDPQNCSKHNQQKHPYIDFGLWPVQSNGRFSFASTRNNNFSNRRQAMQIEVTGAEFNAAPVLKQASISAVLLVVASVVFAALVL